MSDVRAFEHYSELSAGRLVAGVREAIRFGDTPLGPETAITVTWRDRADGTLGMALEFSPAAVHLLREHAAALAALATLTDGGAANAQVVAGTLVGLGYSDFTPYIGASRAPHHGEDPEAGFRATCAHLVVAALRKAPEVTRWKAQCQVAILEAVPGLSDTTAERMAELALHHAWVTGYARNSYLPRMTPAVAAQQIVRSFRRLDRD